MLVHLTWGPRSWIKSAVQLVQHAASNALVDGGLVVCCENCICFVGGVFGSLVLRAAAFLFGFG